MTPAWWKRRRQHILGNETRCVRCGGSPPGLRSATLHSHNRLDLRHASCDTCKLPGIAERLQVQEHDICIRILLPIWKEIVSRDSALFPTEMKVDSPRPSSAARSITAMPRVPDCDENASRPPVGIDDAKVAFSRTAGSVLIARQGDDPRVTGLRSRCHETKDVPVVDLHEPSQLVDQRRPNPVEAQFRRFRRDRFDQLFDVVKVRRQDWAHMDSRTVPQRHIYFAVL